MDNKLNIEWVSYTVENKYFNPVPKAIGLMPHTSDKYKRVMLKQANKWRFFQPTSRVLDLLFLYDKKYWKPGVKLCGA